MSIVFIINIAIVIMLGLFIIGGYHQGFAMKLLSIFCFLVIGYLSWWLSGYLSGIFAIYPKDAVPMQGTPLEGLLYNSLNRICLFLIVFVILQLLQLILRPFAQMMQHIPVVSTLNKILGAILGGIQAVLLLLLITMVCRLPFWSEGNAIAQTSLLRYSDPLMKTITWYAKEPLNELSKLTLPNKDTPLSEKEKANLKTWLLSQNISEEYVDALLTTMQ